MSLDPNMRIVTTILSFLLFFLAYPSVLHNLLLERDIAKRLEAPTTPASAREAPEPARDSFTKLHRDNRGQFLQT